MSKSRRDYKRNFAAQPRSANQTSPGRGFIDQIHNLLFH